MAATLSRKRNCSFLCYDDRKYKGWATRPEQILNDSDSLFSKYWRYLTDPIPTLQLTSLFGKVWWWNTNTTCWSNFSLWSIQEKWELECPWNSVRNREGGQYALQVTQRTSFCQLSTYYSTAKNTILANETRSEIRIEVPVAWRDRIQQSFL